MKNLSHKIAAAVAVLGLGSSIASATITFDARENLNILNSPDVVITANFESSQGLAPWLRGSLGGASDVYQSGIGWFTGTITAPEVITMDMGAIRNMETIRMDGARNITGADIQSSADGVIWSSVLAATTTINTGGSGVETKIVLTTPVDARWLRITSTALANPTSVGLSNLRVYGAAGTVVADKGLDLVARTAWTGGNATYSQTGAAFASAGGLSDVTDDNHANLAARQLTAGMDVGDSAQVAFSQTIQNIKRIGITLGGFNNNLYSAASAGAGLTFELWGSLDNGATYTVDLGGFAGGGVGPNFYTLATGFDGSGIQMVITTVSGSTTAQITDMMVFAEVVPEPSTLALFGMGGLLLAYFRRRQIAR